MESTIERIHEFTMLAKHSYGIGGTNDSIEVVKAQEDPGSHMSIRIGQDRYRSEHVLAALDDLHMKATLDVFTSSDRLLATIFKASNVLDVYAEFRNIWVRV